MIGKKTKEVAARLGNADDLRSVNETRAHIASQIAPRLKDYMAQARGAARAELSPLEQQRQSMAAKHQSERLSLDVGQKTRHEAATRTPAPAPQGHAKPKMPTAKERLERLRRTHRDQDREPDLER